MTSTLATLRYRAYSLNREFRGITRDTCKEYEPGVVGKGRKELGGSGGAGGTGRAHQGTR